MTDAVLPRLWRIWSPLWGRRERFGGWFLHLAAFVPVAAWSAATYYAVVHFNASRGATVWDPALELDRAIPFIGWSVGPYLTHVLYHPLAVMGAPRTDAGRRELLGLYQGQVYVWLISLACFLAFPCEVDLRHQAFEALGAEPAWVRWAFESLYSVDAAWNAWPSLHVSQTLIIVLALARWWTSRAAVITLVFCWLVLCASILTTKQHFLFDLATGGLVGFGVWRASIRAHFVGPADRQKP